MLVGTAQCSGCGQSHRTHTCTACWYTIYSPHLTDRCELSAFDGRRSTRTLGQGTEDSDV